jgi:glycosyltransferase involved in cell wall biosynthesis
MKPSISIIIPCYNQAQYMNESLMSVFEQSYLNWECIIVNDGSSDDTEKEGLKWQKKDSRFVYFKKDNGGLCSARNYGIERAKGKYILPLDCDDKIAKDYIKLGLQKFETDDKIGVVYCKAKFFGNLRGRWRLPAFDKKHLLCVNHIFCSGIFLKEDWQKIGGYDENMKKGWEDWEFWINLLYNLNKTAYRLDYVGFFYRRKNNSMGDLVAISESTKYEIYDYIYNKHKKFYNESFGHPILMFKKSLLFNNREFFFQEIVRILKNYNRLLKW